MMFHTIITFVYILPNIYVFLRIGQLFINKGYRLYYALIYIILALVYPYVSILSSGYSGLVTDGLMVVASYILPFYLYLFLSVLLYDIFLLANLIFAMVPAEWRRSTRYKTAALSSIVLLSSLVVLAGAINFRTIRISEYHVDIPRKSAKADHLKIAFVADFHLKHWTDIHFVERFAKEIELIRPDLIVYGGDIVEGGREDENLHQFEKILKGINSRYGAFGVLGNHESLSRQNKGQFFDLAGITVLSDTFVVIDDSFTLAGRYDNRYNRRKTIGELMKPINDTLPVILIDHRPTELDEVSRTAVDLQMSGHTHNGQLFPLNLIIGRMYQLSWGYKKIDHTHFFVTSGIMLWGPPVRTTGKSEIMVINVRFTEK
ncbi:MAG TPA: metallophosphoesterase [Prolixibacteraceae bacterium]|nr:metallophosphoesterase [Prolixibacteraceae bacterium]